jgi:membrane protein DedA with SNARE-associated domain
MPCLNKYLDLGKPNEGIHAYRMANLAIVDVGMTFVAAWVFSLSGHLSFITWCIILFTIGIILHRIFCVKTTIDKLLFP